MGNCLSNNKDGGWTAEASKRSFSRRADPWEKTGMVAFRSSNLRVRACCGRSPGAGQIAVHLPTAERAALALLCACALHNPHLQHLCCPPPARLQEFPKQVEPIAKKVRVLDGTDNKISEVPDYVGLMTPCNRIGLSKNRIASLPDSISALTNLRVLLLDSNRLRALPPALFALASLERLSLANNLIAELPKRVGHLKSLKQLDLSGNKLTALPRELGKCLALEELRVSDNAIACLPTDLAKLDRLRLVVAENNQVEAVPPEVLRYCEALQTLALHGNPISLERLEATDGFAVFEARRKSKWDKSVAAGVLLGSSRLDEAADRMGARKNSVEAPPAVAGAAGGAAGGNENGQGGGKGRFKGKSALKGKVESHLVDVTKRSVDTT